MAISVSPCAPDSCVCESWLCLGGSHSPPSSQCLTLDKFVGSPDEDAMTRQAQHLLEENKFWAGLVFLDMPPQSTEVPAHVKFKIRMDIDAVERTNKIKDRLIRPGQRQTPVREIARAFCPRVLQREGVGSGTFSTVANLVISFPRV